MSLLHCKSTVRPRNLVIAAAVINAANALGLPQDMWVTAGIDGVHKKGSKHYTGDALDFRTKQLEPTQKTDYIEMVKQLLGPDYDVILEAVGTDNEHGHAEFDP